MPLVTLKYLMRGPLREGYAVGAFNFYGLENLQGIILGAANKKAPVIAMATTAAVVHFGEKAIVGAARGMAEEYGMICRCIDNGFSSVMIDASLKEFDENAEISARVVEYAARTGCSVEAE